MVVVLSKFAFSDRLCLLAVEAVDAGTVRRDGEMRARRMSDKARVSSIIYS